MGSTRRLVLLVPAALLGGSAALLSSCAGVTDDLARADAAYRDARYEAALAWLEDLEEEVPGAGPSALAEYLFLRGMTAYRLDDRDAARHYLALALEAQLPLDAERIATAERALASLLETADEPSPATPAQ